MLNKYNMHYKQFLAIVHPFLVYCENILRVYNTKGEKNEEKIEHNYMCYQYIQDFLRLYIVQTLSWLLFLVVNVVIFFLFSSFFLSSIFFNSFFLVNLTFNSLTVSTRLPNVFLAVTNKLLNCFIIWFISKIVGKFDLDFWFLSFCTYPVSPQHIFL